MDDALWDLLDQTRPSDGDPEAHAAALTEVLVARGPEAAVATGEAFDAALDALYRWDLWGAAYLAMGGCGDDGFEYLRCWLVGRGRATWEQARDDPEALFVALLGDAEDPDARFADELAVHEGEHLLYAAGTAHERLTGAWRPPRSVPGPDEPAGEAWEEDDLPARFPRLAAALPDGWWDDPEEDEGPLAMVLGPQPDLGGALAIAAEGLGAFAGGAHDRARELLEPLIDDARQWEQLAGAGDLDVDVAYAVGIGRLQAGDVDGAAAALGLVAQAAGRADHVRRALAQVELARGELDEAARWIDVGDRAARLDRALAATLAWRRAAGGGGSATEAAERARAIVAAPPDELEHPWDVAGCVLLAGLVLVEAGDLDGAVAAAQAMAPLVVDAPDEVPLHGQLRVLTCGAVRLQGRPEDAVALLDELLTWLEAGDRALALRERARSLRAAGRSGVDEAFGAAVEAFAAAGERWEAEATRAEAHDG